MSEDRDGGLNAEARVWQITVVASFEADNAEDAEAICQRMLDVVVDHPASIEGEASCEEVIAEPSSDGGSFTPETTKSPAPTRGTGENGG